MRRAVLDPGVLIAALISREGTPAKLVRAWLGGQFELVVSPRLLDELRRVLMRPKFRRYVTESEAMTYVEGLQRLTTVVHDPRATPRLTPDPGDDYLVALAQAAGAHCLVSGDDDLTRLNVRPPVRSPRAFLALLEKMIPKTP